jgi:hypothetical protein
MHAGFYALVLYRPKLEIFQHERNPPKLLSEFTFGPHQSIITITSQEAQFFFYF